MIIILRADGGIEAAPSALGRDLRAVQGALGGYVEHVTLDMGSEAEPGVGMLLAEDAKMQRRPMNQAATALLHEAGGMSDDFVAGDVLVLGEKDGEAVDLPAAWEARFTAATN